MILPLKYSRYEHLKYLCLVTEVRSSVINVSLLITPLLFPELSQVTQDSYVQTQHTLTATCHILMCLIFFSFVLRLTLICNFFCWVWLGLGIKMFKLRLCKDMFRGKIMV